MGLRVISAPWLRWALAGFVAVAPLVGCGGGASPADDGGAQNDAPSIEGGDLGGGAETAREAPPGCSVPAPTTCPTPAPTYADVEPIIVEVCQFCHWGDPHGPWPLTTYKHVVDWKDDIRDDLLTCSMPPPDSDVSMTVEQRVKILEWIRCGVPM